MNNPLGVSPSKGKLGTTPSGLFMGLSTVALKFTLQS